MPDSAARTFFDIHMHAMDLSHPNILAFVKRIDGLGWKLILGGLFEPLLKKQEENILNLLTVMENSIEDYFILLEYFLKNRSNVVNGNNTFLIDGEIYNRILLTPLLMDFGYKHITTNTFYNIPPQKPIVEQTNDVLSAIAKYCRYELAVGITGKPNFVERSNGIAPLFEIYPFLGINTQNYNFIKLVRMITKYFTNFSGTRAALNANMGKFNGDIDGLGSNVFAGIKLYPPLGFDPWPEYDKTEMVKVQWLYDYCQEKQIPITIHCSDGGFAVDDDAKKRTNPENWIPVLKQYRRLKINFAHLGSQENILWIIPVNEWRDQIIQLILGYENVYADFSCQAFDDDYYGWLAKLVGKYGSDSEKLKDRILFGSDFMINLMWSPSYNQYLETFFRTERLDKGVKEKFCSVNPDKFLFREVKDKTGAYNY